MALKITNTERLAKLEEAYFSGVMEVEYDGKRVRYQKMSDMLAAINLLRRRMGLSKTSSRKQATYIQQGGDC